QQPFDKFINTFQERFGKSVPKPILHQSNIGETLSLIYSPFYLKDRLYDAILDRAVSANLPENFEFDKISEDRPHWHVHLISTLCPKCGWDLEGERDALVLICKNCNSAWYPVGKKLVQLKCYRFESHAERQIFLPFWRIKADISGISLDSYADLIAIANLPRAVQSGWSDVPFRFWVPAFKVRPKVFLQLATHTTLSQPCQKLLPEMPDDGIYPTNLPIEEAIESLKMTLANFMKPRKVLKERLNRIRIKAKRFSLVFLPFDEGHHEFIQPDFKLTINKNVIRLSKNL
ncbi:MAG: hypothetical protein PVF37_18545, partial [Desulfobacterales bacterium]